MAAGFLAALAMALAAPTFSAAAPEELQQLYSQRVERRLEVPKDEVDRFARLTQAAIDRAALSLDSAQYILSVDRSPWVQAALLFWRSREGEWRLVGASPVSTGLPGTFDHFETPTGVFRHDPSNMDFRAEGTVNSNGIRGYGRKDLRVFDFGWQMAPKGWGDRQPIQMRLQMHATDPDVLEPRLGTAQSKGCIRIPASLNAFLDRHAVLDAEYEALARKGTRLWVLSPGREPVQDPGRFVVVIDSGREERPEWSPILYRPHRAPVPAKR